ncbi:uncharacterized protein BDR25DRAFT_333651 [Lindgomyces ingoldianus]|uniref:Uncharacterized protein n=1 Tax=Lindgomyces ingoldianus TaxID=673940 RepID=A0ACB6QZH5_9PLEO|nr:uncharacterized protein BDR25DRAFT_333651 [Lindgomyces ingoldianus]KAF2472301.1 hypothetical protein BDR25DRAFT_333651 [Lindgomyces ingoldianus]
MSVLTASSFPAELLLEILQYNPFESTATVHNLSLVHPRFRDILENYEISTTKRFARNSLPYVYTDVPDSPNGTRKGYAWLDRCIHHYDTADDIMATLTSKQNCYPVEKHNMALVNTGILILYRLNSIQSYVSKLAFIESLPEDPLMAMFLAVHYSTRTARYHGDGIINQRTYGHFLDANQLSLRNEVEFCFAEGALELGPNFIATCFFGRSFMPPVTQGPMREKRLSSLFTSLLERLAELKDWKLETVVGNIEWEVVDEEHDLSWLDLEGKARLVGGMDLEY